MSNIAKANKLLQAEKLLEQANALVQEALGTSDECYDVHCAIEDIIAQLQEYSDMLEEMQVTD